MAEMAEEGFVDVSKEQDGGLLKKILVEGKGEDTPSPGSSVDVHYVGTLHSDGSKFDSSRDRPGTFKFEVGVGQVIKGWDQGILTMKRGEKCILRCRSDYAYGQNGSPPKIPGDATLNFEVELFDWKEKVKTPAEMTPEERRDHATKMKEAGTEAFKQGDFATAVNRYEDGVEYITFDPDSDDGHGHSHGGMPCSGHGDAADKTEPVELSEADKQLALALLNNCAMARLKNKDPDAAKFDCTKALQYDPKNIKATFRRAQAEFDLHNFKACHEDVARTLELDPSNKDAEALKRKAADAEKKEKKQAIFGVPILKPWYDEWLAETGSEDKFLKWLANTKEVVITGDIRDALREIDEDMCSLLEGMLEKDPEKRFSIIECVNHMFFQKIRNTHLEDLAGILQASDFGNIEEGDEDEDSLPMNLDKSPNSHKSPKSKSETLPMTFENPEVREARRASRACTVM